MVIIMKKIGSLLFMALMFVFVSCQVEEVGPSGENVKYKPIFSFNLNGEYRVTNKVEMKWIDSKSFEVLADVRDQYSGYGKLHIRMVFSSLSKSDYPWARNMSSSSPCSTMELTFPDGAGFSADKTPSDYGNASYAIIENIHTDSRYFSGSFDYTLYKNDPNSGQMISIHLTDGRFHYIGYKNN